MGISKIEDFAEFFPFWNITFLLYFYKTYSSVDIYWWNSDCLKAIGFLKMFNSNCYTSNMKNFDIIFCIPQHSREVYAVPRFVLTKRSANFLINIWSKQSTIKTVCKVRQNICDLRDAVTLKAFCFKHYAGPKMITLKHPKKKTALGYLEAQFDYRTGKMEGINWSRGSRNEFYFWPGNRYSFNYNWGNYTISGKYME